MILKSQRGYNNYYTTATAIKKKEMKEISHSSRTETTSFNAMIDIKSSQVNLIKISVMKLLSNFVAVYGTLMRYE